MPDAQAARTSRLVDVLVDFAALMTSDPPFSTVLQFLVDGAVEVLPVTAASATVNLPGGAAPVSAASSPWALELERSPASAGRLDASAKGSGGYVRRPAGPTDRHLPVTFWSATAAVGPLRVFRIPMSHGQTDLGGLSLYRCDGDAPGSRYLTASRKMADVAAAYLMNTHRRLELQRISELSRQEALHDPLTGLPNRTLIVERLHHACERSRRSGLAVAVLYIDLDGFKSVNDTFGHTAGDQLLIDLSLRLKGLLRPPDTLARLHGDEFVLMCEDMTDLAHAGDIARRLQSALDEPLTVAGTEIFLRASVGVVLSAADTTDAHQILVDADRAMYEAKRRGGAQFWLDDRQQA